MATLEAMTLSLLQKATGYKDLLRKYVTVENGARVSKYTATSGTNKVIIKIYDYGFEAINSRYFIEANTSGNVPYRRFESARTRTLSEALNTVYWEGLS